MADEVLTLSLTLARAGDVDSAIVLLREGPRTLAHLSLLFQLMSTKGTTDDAIAVAGEALSLCNRPLDRSTWALRRGLGHLERQAREQALADLQLVLKLKANEDHLAQARAALVKVAMLPKR